MVSLADQLAHVPLATAPPSSSDTVLSGKGQGDLLGEFTYVDHHIGRPSADGKSLAVTDGVGVLAAANGDALFVSYFALYRASATPGVFPFEGAYFITGGRGRFLGATGSGVTTITVDTNAGKDFYTQIWEGIISPPKP
jgi:hypothetical protein